MIKIVSLLSNGDSPCGLMRGRGPELAGTRFTVFDIIPYWQKGRHPTYIAAIVGLAVEQVETLIDYIENHKDDVLAINEKIEERIAQGNSPEIEAKLNAIRGTARALREELLRKRLAVSSASETE